MRLTKVFVQIRGMVGASILGMCGLKDAVSTVFFIAETMRGHYRHYFVRTKVCVMRQAANKNRDGIACSAYVCVTGNQLNSEGYGCGDNVLVRAYGKQR